MKTIKRYSKILLTTDGSKFAELAIPHAALIAKAFNAELLVLQNIEDLVQIDARLQSPRSNVSQVLIKDTAEEVFVMEKKQAEKNLKKVTKELAELGVKDPKVVITKGNPMHDIIETANKEKCDLIVMSTHGRSGLSRALLGSVADNVLRHAKCPVLLIRTT